MNFKWPAYVSATHSTWHAELNRILFLSFGKHSIQFNVGINLRINSAQCFLFHGPFYFFSIQFPPTVTLTVFMLLPNPMHHLEPVGSVSPKASLSDELQIARVLVAHTLSLTCRVQSYPIPVFR